MESNIPKTAAIHDLSGFGRCSLTVIIPVLSTMGVQVCPLPTAVLSTHSGGFGEFYFHDLTEAMVPFGRHWEETGIEFDCLYSGFLGSVEQIHHVADLFDKLKNKDNTLIVTDPVMGDNGRLYKTYTREMQENMCLLVKKADLITPNLTEAYFLLNRSYSDRPLNSHEMKDILKRLSDMGPGTVVITSLDTTDGCSANIGYDRKQDAYWRIDYDYIPAHYPGTGDIFTSVLIGGILNGDSLPVSIDRATQFVTMAVKTTYEKKTAIREGVLLERLLPWLFNHSVAETWRCID